MAKYNPQTLKTPVACRRRGEEQTLRIFLKFFFLAVTLVTVYCHRWRHASIHSNFIHVMKQ